MYLSKDCKIIQKQNFASEESITLKINILKVIESNRTVLL